MAFRRSSFLASSAAMVAIAANLYGVSFAGTESYTYDALGRILTATLADGSTIQYAYDPLGNRITKAVGLAIIANNFQINMYHGQSASYTFNVVGNANDVSPSGATVTAKSVGAPTHGTSTINGANITYTPTTGYVGSDSFTYSVTDGVSPANVPGTVNVTVGNRAPITNNFPISTGENTTKTFSGISSASDPDGDALTLSALGTPSHGTASYNGNQITYTPSTNFVGSDSFSYTVADPYGATGTSTVVVSVNSAPPPVANLITIPVAHNTAYSWNPLTNSVTDPNAGATVTVTAAAGASHGTLSNTTNSITYTPTSGYAGSDSFIYTVTDSLGSTASNTVNVNVAAAPPVANPITIPVTHNTAYNWNPLTNSVTDSNTGATLSVTAASGASHGTLSNTATSITYTPNAGYVGSDTFTYTVADNFGGSASNTVSVSVAAGAPGANPITIPVTHNTAYTWNPLTSSVTDPNSGATLSVSSAAGASHGTLSNTANSITYTPTSGYVGSDSFTYTVTDSDGATASNTVSVNVGAGAPAASPISISTVHNRAYSWNPLTNSVTDPNTGATLSVTGATGASHGTLSNSANSITYTPTSGYVGADSFTYTVADSDSVSASNTVSVSVTNQNPVVVTQTAQVTCCTSPANSVSIPGLAGDSDPDGDTISISAIAASPSNGSVAVNGSNLVYTPNANFSGNDSFTYTIIDGFGGSATATTNVQVLPLANDHTFTYIKGAAKATYFTPTVIVALANIGDLGYTSIQSAKMTNGSRGSVSINGNTIVFTGPQTTLAIYTSTFTYTLVNAAGGTATATITVNVDVETGT